MSMDATISLVVFDLGGVIVRHCRTWDEGLKAAGLDVRQGVEPEDAEAMRMQLGLSLLCGLISVDQFVAGVAETTGHAYTVAEVGRVHAAWMGDAYEGVAPVIERLAGIDVSLAVLSNMDERHWLRLTQGSGRLAAIEAVPMANRFASFEMGLAKPMPGIYAEVERRMGVAAERILFFDDQLENTLAAERRGWSTELIDWRESTAEQIDRALVRRGLLPGGVTPTIGA